MISTRRRPRLGQRQSARPRRRSAAAGHQHLAGRGRQYEFSLVTFNVLDGRGQNVRTPTAFDLWLSDSSTGAGLDRDRGKRRRRGRVVHQPGRRLRGRQQLPGGSRQDRPAVAG